MPHDVLMPLCAAGLGAGFHGIWTALPYMKRGTFDERYAPRYVARWLLGVASGTVLALLFSDLINKGGPEYEYGPSMLAVVGGWSAEAVAQVLNRVADTLVVAVRGKSSEKSEGEVERVKREAEALRIKERSELAAAVERVRALAGAQGAASDEVRTQLDALTKHFPG